MNTLTKNSLVAITLMAASASSSIAFASQGTLTATFFNDCSGFRNVGVNALLMLDDGMMGERFTLNVPEKYYDPMKQLWLKCGEKVTRTLNYDFPYGVDYQLQALMVRTSYVDNYRSPKEIFDRKMYNNWPVDGTHCTITYTGHYPPVSDINCSKQ